MPFQPFISVIIPAYNAAAFIEETLRSVQAQSYPHFEVIIVDDGPTDDAAQTAENFAAKDSRFRLFRRNKKSGLASARNAGLKEASGELIAFLDADDVWLPEKLKTQVATFENHSGTNLCFTNYHLWDGSNKLGQRYNKPADFPKKEMRTEIIHSCLFAPSSVLIRRAILDKVGGFDESLDYVEDWDLWLRISNQIGLEPLCVREPMLLYRLHAGNMSKHTAMRCEQTVRVLEKNRDATKISSNLRHYRRSLQIARSNLALAGRASFWRQIPVAFRRPSFKRGAPTRAKSNGCGAGLAPSGRKSSAAHSPPPMSIASCAKNSDEDF